MQPAADSQSFFARARARLMQFLDVVPPEGPVLFALLALTGLCTLTLGARMLASGRAVHLGLIWNLFLAWIPMTAAAGASALHRARYHWLGVTALGAIWLVFFPNAPYLLTDLIHLSPRPGAPLWYDLILVASFSLTGLFLGLVSLRLMQALVTRTVGAVSGWCFVVASVVLASFGMYLGRFQRFNSWDTLVQPGLLFDVVWERLANPFAHLRTVFFSGLFAGLLLAVYLIFFATAAIRLEPEER